MENIDYFPNLEDFRALSKDYNLLSVTCDILADDLTPVSAFKRIDDGSDGFLLESVEGGEKWGRYSFFGASSRGVIRAKGSKTEIFEGGVLKRTIEGNPLDTLKDYLAGFKAAPIEGTPRFPGGAIGYMGYDIVRHIERLPNYAERDLDIDEFCFLMTDIVMVFDNEEGRIKIICNAYLESDTDIDWAYGEATRRIAEVASRLKDATPKTPRKYKDFGGVTSNFKKEDYLETVKRVKRYIGDGDVIQTVISQRFECELASEPFDIYRALRVTNPSPYMFFLRLGGIELAGSSPEILVRLEDGEVVVRPIAGTRPRGKDEAEDIAFEKELLADPKECAEHIMLVDLGRNDVGRVAETSSVTVDEFMGIERYSHVMHIVSNVRGRMREGLDAFDAFKASFPAGTLTGAPKIRAMEIIEELEPTGRGVYGGSVGYFGFSGMMDLCITIRTVLIKDDRVYVQAGAGIVADSEPEKEFEECVNKAKGVLKAVEMAAKGI
ncbi:MAG: anthranilate synthase component I [Deltaproteobacteria bacterium]|nr:anthranilate synthase component I [Deltaproteobacteria bacterium]